MAAILLKDITIDGSLKDILIQGSRISKIGEAGDSVGWEIYGDIETMDCSGMVAIPGFVNMHTHSPMSLMSSSSAGSRKYGKSKRISTTTTYIGLPNLHVLR